MICYTILDYHILYYYIPSPFRVFGLRVAASGGHNSCTGFTIISTTYVQKITTNSYYVFEQHMDAAYAFNVALQEHVRG